MPMVSTPFEDKSYYVNIRKAITAGFFMQVRLPQGPCMRHATRVACVQLSMCLCVCVGWRLYISG
jgi:hypothetical protein